MSVSIVSPDLQKLVQRLAQAEQMHTRFVSGNMNSLGRRLAYIVRRALNQNKYTGGLQNSVKSQLEGDRLEVGPTLKRRGYDAGWLLEEGTRPIPRLPFGPIKKWAEFRGIPAGPVWYKIKTRGVSPHPWLDRAMSAGDTRVAIENTAKRIGMQLATFTMKGTEAQGNAPEIFG